MSSLKLYEIADQYLHDLNALESLADLGQIDEQAYVDTLEGLSGDLEVKALNVVSYARNLEFEAKTIKAAIEPMQARAKSLETKAEWMRNYIKQQMERTGIAEIKSPHFVMKLRDNQPKVVIDNESGIPDDCWRVIPETREPDKKAIKEKIESGESVGYAHIERGKRLEIK